MKNLLSSIKLWQKFSAIGVIAAVLCAVPLVQVIQYKNSEIATAQAENAGLGQVRTAAVLQRHLHAHRGLSSMVLHGNAGAGAGADADRRSHAAGIDTTLVQLAQQTNALGYTQASAELAEIKKDWTTLAAQVGQGSIQPAQSFQAHTALLAREMKLLDLIADASGMSLDPAAETYYLVTALVDHLPHLAEATAQVRGVGVGMLSSASVNPADRATIRMSVREAWYADERAQRQIAKAVAIDPEVGKTVTTSTTAGAAGAASFFKLTEAELLAEAPPSITTADYFKVGTVAVEAQYKTM